MIVEQSIQSALYVMFNEQLEGLDPEAAKVKMSEVLATIIADAIKTGTVTIPNTELITKVISAAPGSPVVCTLPLLGSIT